MFELSYLYNYGVGGAIYGVGAFICLKHGVLDLKIPRERRIFWSTTGCFGIFAVVHGLFQFVFPHLG
jgi:hypothetical protein